MRLLVPALAAGLVTGCAAAPAGGPVAGITVPARSPDAVTSAFPEDSYTPSPSSGPPRPSSSTTRSWDAPPPPVEDPRSELDVEDQAGDGRSVVVAEAALGRGAGWVVISSVSGVQLGAAPVRPGIRLLRVVLDEPTNGGTLRVQLFEDDGDGRFDATRDPRVTEDGEPQGETLRYVLE